MVAAQLALGAADRLEADGIPTRVVSMPCREWFDAQDAGYRNEVLPSSVRARVSVEAGIAMPWRDLIGDAGEAVSLEQFGASAPYQVLFEQFGITVDAVVEAARRSLARAGEDTVVTCSAHKEPVRAATTLYRMAQEIPDTLLIAHIGRSNGAGPTLSALTTVPVITVPASGKEFPEDVWSSLRAPSKVPVMTVLDPANAVLAALNILSARNPRIYAHVRAEIEARTVNTILV